MTHKAVAMLPFVPDIAKPMVAMAKHKKPAQSGHLRSLYRVTYHDMIGAMTKMTRKKGRRRAEASIVPGIAQRPLTSEDCVARRLNQLWSTSCAKEWTHVDVVDEVEEAALDGDEEEREREVAAVLEETVVEEPGRGSLPLCIKRNVLAIVCSAGKRRWTNRKGSMRRARRNRQRRMRTSAGHASR